MKGKVSYELVTAIKFYTPAAKPQAIGPLTGKHIQVGGILRDNTLMIASIREVQRHIQISSYLLDATNPNQ